jgi:hypothetical protein
MYFNFPIVNFPFIYSNIPAAPAYGVYISTCYDSQRPVTVHKERTTFKVMTSTLLIRTLGSVAYLLASNATLYEKKPR